MIKDRYSRLAIFGKIARRRDTRGEAASMTTPIQPMSKNRDEMALKAEGVVDGSVHTEKALEGSSRFEPLILRSRRRTA
jgi:hypothetical protein